MREHLGLVSAVVGLAVLIVGYQLAVGSVKRGLCVILGTCLGVTSLWLVVGLFHTVAIMIVVAIVSFFTDWLRGPNEMTKEQIHAAGRALKILKLVGQPGMDTVAIKLNYGLTWDEQKHAELWGRAFELAKQGKTAGEIAAAIHEER